MKSTIVIYGSSTGTCQSIAETIAGKLGTSAVDVSSIDEAAISGHDNLILGTSTWGAGELQDDWYDGINLLKPAGLTHLLQIVHPYPAATAQGLYAGRRSLAGKRFLYRQRHDHTR